MALRKHKYQVAIRMDTGNTSGILISKNLVLTCAHGLYDGPKPVKK
jgi:V8-like Glu-specific endopeptidase